MGNFTPWQPTSYASFSTVQYTLILFQERQLSTCSLPLDPRHRMRQGKIKIFIMNEIQIDNLLFFNDL